MENLRAYMTSGILESYIMGTASSDEIVEVEQLAAQYDEIRMELNKIEEELETFSIKNAVSPDPLVRPFVLASIDYSNRMINGEQPSFPPLLCASSNVADYLPWLGREDMVLDSDFRDVHAKIIGYGPQGVIAITWIKDMAPQELHDDELESFLIVEGTCDITIDGTVHSLVPGDFLAIPLYKDHSVKVTSDFPCKVILQRLAA